MNFEDIVDMEWVDSHTTLDETNEFATDYYFDHQPDFLLEQPVTPSQPLQHSVMEPEINMEPIANMPTTEQIKQLIEIAKHQLALREQLQQTQHLTQHLTQQQTQQQQQQQQQQQAEQTQQQPLFQSLSTQQPDVHTAAPSTIFAPPPVVATLASTTPAMPALSPSTVASTDMILAQLMPTAAFENVAENASQTSLTADGSKARRDSLASMAEESISLEAYAEADGIDLKKLTPKERRQLRNKISARNFRVRRKEYISTLEGQVNEHKLVAENLREKLVKVEEENKKLRKEMDTLKRQNQILQQQQQQQKNPASPRISSPLPKPNLNKDISILGTKASDSYRQQDNCILVSNAVMPVWDYSAILHKQPPKQSQAGPDYMKHIAGQFILSIVQLARNMPRGTNQISENDYYKPLMPDDRDFTSSTTFEKESPNPASSFNYPSTFNYTTALSTSFPASHSIPTASYIEDLYDILIQSALINSSTADKSFLWGDNNTTRTM